MTDKLQELYETGLKFHGHKCPAMPAVERVTREGDFVCIACSGWGS